MGATLQRDRRQVAQAIARDQLAMLAEAQRTIAADLLGACRHANEEGLSWRKIAAALGMDHVTIFEQVRAGSPVSVVQPFRTPKSHSSELPRGDAP